ncbi:MAG: hypothetical protein HY721_08785 [Planctomycetes bacterium]|nr:hypothetical protein [Planctomycetota bacterium]
MIPEDRSSRTILEAPPACVLRKFVGPEASEVYVLSRPDALSPAGVRGQAASAYRMLQDALAAEGASLEHVVQETVFFRDIERDMEPFLAARGRHFGLAGADGYNPASTYIEQPPLDGPARFEVLATAVVPARRLDALTWDVQGVSPCACDPCARVGGRAFRVGGLQRLHSGNLYGAPGPTYDEAYTMFRAAEELLRRAGMDFRHVVRTWIHLRHMERDYSELNRARRVFFQELGLSLRPASTGIQGGPFPEEHNFSLSLYAVKADSPIEVQLMTTPTLNEAWTYGSDFSRGLRVVESNRVALFVSGTASVDEEGRTAHIGDFDAQVDRMLVNIETLLERQDATWADVVSAITYLKDAADAPALRRLLKARGLQGLPNAIVKAPVCRPDLLCEMEALALLPLEGE